MIILDLQTVRIDISSKIKDTRASQLLTSLSQLELSSELESLQIVDSYTIQADLTAATIKKAANNLIDFKKEQLMIATNLHDFDFAIEIGFLPGVTDNLAKTVTMILKDSLKQNVAINVYSSQVFLLKGNLSEIDLKQIIDSLHNPLIQRARIKTSQEFNRHPAKPRFASDVDTKKVGTVQRTSSVSKDKGNFRKKSIGDISDPRKI